MLKDQKGVYWSLSLSTGALTPARRAGTRFTYPGYVVGYVLRLFRCSQISSNWARRRANVAYRTLCVNQTTACHHVVDIYNVYSGAWQTRRHRQTGRQPVCPVPWVLVRRVMSSRPARHTRCSWICRPPLPRQPLPATLRPPSRIWSGMLLLSCVPHCTTGHSCQVVVVAVSDRCVISKR